MTLAEVYGLKENPFEPTGAAVGKYPFVPPANFDALESKIRQAAIERKLYVLLVSSPHGAGKSTMMEELRKRAIQGAYMDGYRAPVILTRLSNLSLEEFAGDTLQEALPYLKGASKGLSPRDSATMLRKKVVTALAAIAERSKLLLWIVDEFDILADRPEGEQQAFLQFLRGAIDDLAVKDLPVVLIMSHTRYSSREFEVHLAKVHGPFQSRVVASVSLGYAMEEVTRIVVKRLGHASGEPRSESDLAPFTEAGLRTLFGLVTSIRGTETLDNFRVFERCCHFALLEGAERRLPQIGPDVMEKVFREFGLKDITTPEARRLSMKTRQALMAIRGAPLLERNEAVLRGLVRAISKSQMLGGKCTVEKYGTSYFGSLLGKFEISVLSMELAYEDRSIRVSWYLVATASELILQEEGLKLLDSLADVPKKDELYAHVLLLSYISSVESPRMVRPSFDRVLWFPSPLAEDLVGLSVGAESDTRTLIQTFDAGVGPHLAELISREVRDITAPLSPSASEFVQVLYVMHSSNQVGTKESLRVFHKRLFGRSNLAQQRYVREIIQLGFAREEAAQIVPEVPRAHRILLEKYLKDRSETKGHLSQLFGPVTQYVLSSAEAFGLVRWQDGAVSARRLADLEKELEDPIRALREYSQNEVVSQSEPGERIGWLLRAFDTAKSQSRTYDAFVVLSVIRNLGPGLQSAVAGVVKAPSVGGREAVVRPQGPSVEEERPQELVSPPIISPGARAIAERAELPAVEESVKRILREAGPLTLTQLEERLAALGYEEDVRTVVMRMILSSRLRITLASNHESSKNVSQG